MACTPIFHLTNLYALVYGLLYQGHRSASQEGLQQVKIIHTKYELSIHIHNS